MSIFIGIMSCEENAINSATHANTKIPSKNLVPDKIETKRGQLIYKKITPIHSVMAYQGTEFFLVTTPHSPRGLMLLPSQKVDRNTLKSFHNQQVEITSIYVTGTRPSDSITACPVDINGQCMVQGEGYRVLSIRALQK